jgi:glyoxylase-like metal-dependent hydrolase (beta-lactamase superfamily II)
MKKTRPIVGIALAACLVLAFGGQAQTLQVRQSPPGGELEVVEVRPNVHMIVGAGSNILVHVGWMGAIVVDTGSADMSDEVLGAIRRITDKPIRMIINTGADAHHVGGNEALAGAGVNLLRGNPFGQGAGLNIRAAGAGIMAHENVLLRMSAPTGKETPFTSEAWPTEAFTGARNVSLYLNGDGVQMMYQPNAHSNADTFVFFRKADVVAAGDIIDLRHFPIIDVENGGTINGTIDALNRLIELTVPAAPMAWHEDRTLIVPGHGRVMDQADVVEYRDMLTIIRDRVQDLIKKGQTLDQIKKANPTAGFRKQYGPDSGPWTTDMFVTAVHGTLTTAKPTGASGESR